MFPLIGVGEVVSLLVDAAIVSLVSTRWGFAWVRMAGAWLAVSAATVALLVAVLTAVAQASGWGSSATTVVAVGCLPAWLFARALTLRRMSRSPSLRRDPSKAFGWGWAIAVSVGGLVLAMALGGVVNALAGDS